jgi:hypothetical protein
MDLCDLTDSKAVLSAIGISAPQLVKKRVARGEGTATMAEQPLGHRRARVLVILVGVATLTALAGCNSDKSQVKSGRLEVTTTSAAPTTTQPATTATTARTTTTEAPTTTTAAARRQMPNVLSQRLDVAKTHLGDAGYLDSEIQIVGGGTFGVINSSAWVVCSQEPKAGSITENPRVIVARPGEC